MRTEPVWTHLETELFFPPNQEHLQSVMSHKSNNFYSSVKAFFLGGATVSLLHMQQIEGCSLKVQGCNPLVSMATIYIPCVYYALCVKSQEDIP